MASIKDRAVGAIVTARRKVPLVDRVVRMQEHYGEVQATQWAGASTYFAFLSFFPILALAFFAVGYVAKVFPNARMSLINGINDLLPGLIGGGTDQVSLSNIQNFSGLAGLIGLAGVLYAGLAWLSSLRAGLIVLFELPERDQPNFFTGKLRDLLTLITVGVVLIVSLAVSSLVTTFSKMILGFVGLADTLSPLLVLLAILLGLGASTVLFFTIFKLLSDTETPAKSLWQGALLGAVGFEILKYLATFVIASTKSQPAFQAFGIALTILILLNYFSRVLLYAAAFAYVSPQARAARGLHEAAPVQGPQLPTLALTNNRGRPAWVTPFAAGGAAMLGVFAYLRNKE